MAKRNLLELATERFSAIERKELYASILCGELLVNGERVRDPKRLFPREVALELQRRRYVSRGGEKLTFALQRWMVPVEGSVWVDAGSSTGGFTDALLQFGASHVHAVDVGTNQLDYSLRQDSRVTVREGTSLFDLTHPDPPAEYACCDLSFRSLRGAAAHLLSLTSRGRLIALIKPQFELQERLKEEGSVDRDSFDGVLRDPARLEDILRGTLEELWQNDGAIPEALIESPIRGGRGNREFLVDLRRGDAPSEELRRERVGRLLAPLLP